MRVQWHFVLFLCAGICVVLVPNILFFAMGIFAVNADYEKAGLIVGVGTGFVAVVAMLLVLMVMLRRFGRPVDALLRGIQQISDGNLSPDLPDDAPAEFGAMREALSTMCGQMRMILSQLSSLSGHVAESTSGAGISFSEVQKGAEIQSETAARTFETIDELSKGLFGVSSGVESLARRIDRGASQVLEMDAVIGHVTEMTSGLTMHIDEADQTTRIGDQNARALARDLDGLSANINIAQAALREMMEDVAQVRDDAGDTAGIMSNLESEAESIGAAIENVIKGSDAAQSSNERILEVTANLQSRVNRVDDVIEVIRNLAERTKLLSINASIIASEAGEHGRAFAVVAREVKDLAGSTAGAIAEISKVVVSLKDGFNQTVETIQRGQVDVDQGVQLAKNAVVLLGSIPEQVHKASSYNSQIAERTRKQVEKSSQIEEIISKTGMALGQVTHVLMEQVARNEHILDMFQDISSTADQILKATKNHARVSGDVSGDVAKISDNIRGLTIELTDYVNRLGNVVRLSENVMSITNSNRQRTEELSSLIQDLNRFALYLGDDFRKLGAEGKVQN